MIKHAKCKKCLFDPPCSICDYAHRNIIKPITKKLKRSGNVGNYGHRKKDLHLYFKYEREMLDSGNKRALFEVSAK